MTTCVVMQPQYLPRLHYFDLLDQADVFVLLDTVAVSKQSHQTRVEVRAREGKRWLSVPTNATPGLPLNEVRVDNTKRWREKHRGTLYHAYGHAPHWLGIDWLMGFTEPMWERLAPLTSFMVGLIAEDIGCTTHILKASALSPTTCADDPIDRLRHICAQVGAHEYLSPQGARSYLEGHDIGVPVRWHEYEHPVYDQGGAEWMSHLSVVDLLAWHGPASLDIIRGGRV